MRGVELLRQGFQGGAIATLLRSRRPLTSDPDSMQEAVHRVEFISHIDSLLAKAREFPHVKALGPSPGFLVNTGSSAIALSAATAKTVMYVNSATNYEPTLTELTIGFDGVTASAVPVLCELCYGTAATNSTPGTGSTTFTPLQTRGFPTKAASCTAANNCTSEPTVLTSHRQWLVTPNGGLLVLQWPLGREPTGIVTASTSGLQLAIRLNAPATVNARGYLEFEE